jgi:acetyltransferase-like isoleucine patch superfamily enzyme
VEKPLALDVATAEELCELSEARGLTLMVGHLLQYHPAFLQLREVVHSGRLGRIQYIYSNRLNLGKIRREENILWSFAPHDVSMILALIGAEPDGVLAVASRYLHEEIADVTTTHLSFPAGERAHVFVSWLHPVKEQRLVLVCDRGMAVFDDSEPWERKVVVYEHHIEWRQNMPEPVRAEGEALPIVEKEPLREECSHFIECVRSESRPRTDGYEGLRVLKVLQQAQQSMDQSFGSQTTAPAPASPGAFVHETAVVDEPSVIGDGTKIWHFSHVLKGSQIGRNCVLGQNVVVGPDVTVGDDCKIQNNVSLYAGVTLEDGVFCGPSAVFTNVLNPRARVERKDEFRETRVGEGASIGANATIVCGHGIGAYSFIAAGAVVTTDVPAHALMVGVPARQVGWVSHDGEILGDDLDCPRSGRRYEVTGSGELREVVRADDEEVHA